MNFKINNEKELSLFRNVAEQIALDGKYDNEDLLAQKIEELNYHKNELVERMSNDQHRRDIIFGTVLGVTGAVTAVASATSIGHAALGLPGFVSAVYTALKIGNPENIHDTNGMKYLALASKKGILK